MSIDVEEYTSISGYWGDPRKEEETEFASIQEAIDFAKHMSLKHGSRVFTVAQNQVVLHVFHRGNKLVRKT